MIRGGFVFTNHLNPLFLHDFSRENQVSSLVWNFVFLTSWGEKVPQRNINWLCVRIKSWRNIPCKKCRILRNYLSREAWEWAVLWEDVQKAQPQWQQVFVWLTAPIKNVSNPILIGTKMHFIQAGAVCGRAQQVLCSLYKALKPGLSRSSCSCRCQNTGKTNSCSLFLSFFMGFGFFFFPCLSVWSCQLLLSREFLLLFILYYISRGYLLYFSLTPSS